MTESPTISGLPQSLRCSQCCAYLQFTTHEHSYNSVDRTARIPPFSYRIETGSTAGSERRSGCLCNTRRDWRCSSCSSRWLLLGEKRKQKTTMRIHTASRSRWVLMIGSEKREELLLVPNVRGGRVFLYPRDVIRVLAILLIEAIHIRTLSVSESFCSAYSFQLSQIVLSLLRLLNAI